MKARNRPDKDGTHRGQYEKNRRTILKTQTICAICGQSVDFSLKFPHPMSATVDHIVPINKGGHPSDIENLQLAHFICNRLKSDKFVDDADMNDNDKVITNRDLPPSRDWQTYSDK